MTAAMRELQNPLARPAAAVYEVARSNSVDVRPTDIQLIGNELAVKWDDGSESYVPLERLRRSCPCAGCKGETDIMGNLYKNPDQPLAPAAFQLVRVAHVGGYAIQPVWADGHGTGLYSFDYLRKVADSV
jgi:DUF971 family protein